MSRHNRRRTRGGGGGYRLPPSQLSNAHGNTYSTTNTIISTSGNPVYPRPPPSLSSFAVVEAYSNSTSSSGLGLGYGSSLKLATSPASTPPPNTMPRTGVSARHWHNRYMAWQAREKRQRDEQARLEEEKRRIFGVGCGEDGYAYRCGYSASQEDEEDGLCEKMLEYFGGLDFIE